MSILRDNIVLYHGAGDPAVFTFVDTISLNNDNVPDFVYVYQDEYSVVGMFVSQPGGKYKSIDLGEFFDPHTYDTTISKGADIATLRLRDIDGDGRRDVIINGLNQDSNYKIPRWTETVSYQQLRRVAAGKLKPKNIKAGK